MKYHYYILDVYIYKTVICNRNAFVIYTRLEVYIVLQYYLNIVVLIVVLHTRNKFTRDTSLINLLIVIPQPVPVAVTGCEVNAI